MRLTGTSPHWHRMVALVSLTVMVAAYTEAHCSNCGRLLMTVPGNVTVVVRSVRGNGSGRVILCKCKTFCQVVEYVA